MLYFTDKPEASGEYYWLCYDQCRKYAQVYVRITSDGTIYVNGLPSNNMYSHTHMSEALVEFDKDPFKGSKWSLIARPSADQLEEFRVEYEKILKSERIEWHKQELEKLLSSETLKIEKEKTYE